MKYFFGLILFAGLFFSELSLASDFDTTFTKSEISGLTPQSFETLPKERKDELVVISILALEDEEAAALYNSLRNMGTKLAIKRYSNGLPPFVINPSQSRSPRTIVLTYAGKEFAKSFAKNLLIGTIKHTVTLGAGSVH